MLSARVWVMNSTQVEGLVSHGCPNAPTGTLGKGWCPSLQAPGLLLGVGMGGLVLVPVGKLAPLWGAGPTLPLVVLCFPLLSIIVHYIHLRVSMVAVGGVQGCFIVLSSTCS